MQSSHQQVQAIRTNESERALVASLLLDPDGLAVVKEYGISPASFSSRALGWDTPSENSSAGHFMRRPAFGHTGFTGTSLWIDPDRDMFVVLLTNRVHQAKAKRPAKVISDVRADLADAAALAVTDYGDGPLAMPQSFRADKAVGWNRPVRQARHSSKKKSAARSSSAAHSAPSSKSSSKASSTALSKRHAKPKPTRR